MKRVFLPIFLLFIMSGCSGMIYNMEQIFQEEENMTLEMAETFAQEGVRIRFLDSDADDNFIMTESADGKMIYKIDYNSIETPVIETKLHELTVTLEGIVDPRNKSHITKYIEDLNIKDKQLYKLKILKEIESGYTRLNKYKEFLKKLGMDEKTIEMTTKELNDGLAIRWPGFLEEKTQFEPTYVSEARKKPDTMKSTHTFVLNNFEFYVTKDNPDYPQKDNTKKTIKELESFNLLFSSIDINNDKEPDWIEMYQLDNNGIPGKYPAIGVYKTIDESKPVLLVYDIDNNPNHPSYGIPDGFATTYDVKNGLDIIKNQKPIFETVLNGRLNEKKINFEENKAEMKLYSVRPGDIIIVEYEINEDGWPLPTQQYKFNDNFVLYYKIASQENSITDDESEGIKIEWIAKKYHGKYEWQSVQERVVEFYKLKPEYIDKEFEKFDVFKNDTVKFSLLDEGKLEEWGIKYFIDEHPFKIDYDSGEDRITLIDEDADQKYEKMSKEQKIKENIGLENNDMIKKEKDNKPAASDYGRGY